jgi:hypothetical protein
MDGEIDNDNMNDQHIMVAIYVIVCNTMMSNAKPDSRGANLLLSGHGV